MPKKYRSSTGIDEFYYAPLLAEPAVDVYTGPIERVKWLQTIEIENPQEITRAYGDNKTAELAVSNGNTTVSGGFHTLPQEDKDVLFGLEVVDGLSAYGSTDTSPYVACVFAKTYEDGSKQWVGLTKGMFMKNNIAGATKEDGTTFTTDEISAEFMEREVAGFTTEKTVITAADEKGSTVNRDALFLAVFGLPYPVEAVVPEGV
ncbi:major tail protein [Planococcus sp. SE5232]|uniref:major tail protein n=1 Tax=unclassified Planococcus (in: firmicutes) TaxID=2662419 RepID=UPI003D6A4733